MEYAINFNWRKYLLNFIFVFGFIYALFVLRYFIYLIAPSEELANKLMLHVYHLDFYLNPLSNKIMFLMHIAPGAATLMLAPFVFWAYKKNSTNFKFFARLYMIAGLLTAIPFPIIILSKAQGVSTGYLLLWLVEIIPLYLLARGYFYFRRNEMGSFMIFFIYQFSFQVTISFNRLIDKILTTIYPKSLIVMSHEQAARNLIFDTDNAAVDMGLLVYLVLAVVLAKILMYLQIINKT